MNRYEFYSTILQEDFPVKYREAIAENDADQRKEIRDLKAQLAKVEAGFDEVCEGLERQMKRRIEVEQQLHKAINLLISASEPTAPVIRYAEIKKLLLDYAATDERY